jgi:predicted enzyme related to lactoylglutathione lyase
VGVDDVAASTRKAKELGAKVMMDKTEIADAGWMSVIVDPTGATIALWQPKPRQGGQKK